MRLFLTLEMVGGGSREGRAGGKVDEERGDNGVKGSAEMYAKECIALTISTKSLSLSTSKRAQ